MIYDNFVRLCANIGKSPSAVALEIGITKSTVSNWKRRKNGPSDVTLEKMAQYFGIPVSDLTGEQKEPAPSGSGLDAETMELIEFAQTASPAEKKMMMDMIENMKKLRVEP